MDLRVSSAVAFIVATVLLSLNSTSRAADSVVVQLLAFNDFHGHLEPPTGSNGRIGSTPAGGVEYLSTHLRQLEAQNSNTLIVASGDLIGASPLLSGLFHDEPTIEALTAAGLDVAAVGNHEFDDGAAELLRMQYGGCHPTDGCHSSTPFPGAGFQYLAANVIVDAGKVDRALRDRVAVNTRDGQPTTLLPAFAVKEIGGVTIGFVGLTLKGTADLVGANGIQGLTFEDEADSINRFVPALTRRGVRAIVVLVHQGGSPSPSHQNGCDGVRGAIAPIAEKISDEVDVIVSGHTHHAYICIVDDKLVTGAASFGRLITAIDLQIDRATNNVLSKHARNVIVTRDVARSPDLTAILDRYRPAYEAVADRVAGTISGDISRQPNSAGESALGNVVADAILEATAPAAAGGAVIGLMNPAGIRADLTAQPGSGDATPVRYRQVYDVLPFQNRLVVKTFTGQMIKDILEQQFDNPMSSGVPDTILQGSFGFSYAYDRSKPKGARVDVRSIMIAGQTLEETRKYRIGLPDFLADGGDRFPLFTQGTDLIYSVSDADALAAYIGRHSPLRAPATNRITRTN